MNKIYLLITVLLTCLFNVSMAQAATWYVRDGGGNLSQCNGHTDATLAGSSGGNCAYNHPRYVMGWGCTSSGNACGGGSNRLGSSDTLIIHGDSDNNPGQQAQYEIGYDDTNSGLTPGCSTGFPYDCTLGTPPGGTVAQPTVIMGIGTHKPQLWGTQRVWQVLTTWNDNVKFQWLEITDHLGCGYNAPSGGCNYNGPYPWGQWGEDGIFIAAGNNVIMTDVYVHGMGRYGISSGTVGDLNFTRTYSIGNGYGGITIGNNGNTSANGTITLNQPIVEWSGCIEAYPLSSAGIDNPLNYSKCYGQDLGGYGDGVAFGASGNQNAGNWVILGPGSISYNLQDGLDTLHGNGNGSFKIDKMLFAGNGGNQVKINATTSVMTNSVVFGNCGWWWQSAQLNPSDDLGDICRALGNSISYFTNSNGSNYSYYNNTIYGNGNIQFLQNGTCNSTDILNIKNNLVYGGYDWIDDTAFNGAGGNSIIHYIFAGGIIGIGTGCNQIGGQTINEDYNLLYNMSTDDYWCHGPHDICGVNPQLSGGLIPSGHGSVNAYYRGLAGITLVGITSSSPAKAAGISGLTYWNNSNDYYNEVRPSPMSIGAEEVASCAVSSFTPCFFNSDCCSASCTNNVCGGGITCSPNLSTCSTGSQCCNSFCCVGVCGGSSCQSNPSTNLNDFTLSGSLGR